MIERLGQPFFLPSIVFGFAYLTAPYQQHLPESIRTIFQDPIWALALVTILAGVFNRGKTLLTILLLSITMFYSDGVSSGSIFDHPLFEFGVAAIIPMNLAIIILLRERGVLTRSGCLRLIIISAQFIAIYQLSLTVPTLQLDWLSYPVISSSESWPQFLPVSQVGFLTSLGALLVVTTATIARPTPITNSIFGAILGFYLIMWIPLSDHVEGAFTIGIAILLANGLLRDYYNMAYKDELTNMPQRRALNEQMASLGRHYSLAMLDVDHFKKFNDKHGHDVGDQVLQMVGAQIKKVGGGGRAYRYGGEEFTVVFPGLDAEQSSVHLEHVRQSIENYEMVIRKRERTEEPSAKSHDERQRGSFSKAEKTVSVTISIGVAARQSRSEQPEDVLKRADEALYKAKKAGRNRIKVDV